MTSRKVPCLLPPVVPFLSETVVVIPALDEAASIGETIRRWRELGAGRVRVVDNGCTDDTAAEAMAHGAEVVREGLRGYGAAAWRGLDNWPAATSSLVPTSSLKTEIALSPCVTRATRFMVGSPANRRARGSGTWITGRRAL